MTSTEGTLRSPAGTSASAGTPFTAGWGKDKLVVLLRDQGWQCSTSMVGRILRRLKRNGRLVEAPGADPWHPRRPLLLPYGAREPKEHLASPAPGPRRGLFPGSALRAQPLRGPRDRGQRRP